MQMVTQLNRGRFENMKIFVSLFLSIQLLTGWNTLLSGQEYIIQVADYGMEEGLSHTDVQSIHQDREGFMWIGTNYGLNRFVFSHSFFNVNQARFEITVWQV